MKNIKLLFTLVLMTITILGTSCSDWLDDISPRHAIPQSALTDDDLEKLLNGVYATMENYTFTFWWSNYRPMRNVSLVYQSGN